MHVFWLTGKGVGISCYALQRDPVHCEQATHRNCARHPEGQQGAHLGRGHLGYVLRSLVFLIT